MTAFRTRLGWATLGIAVLAAGCTSEGSNSSSDETVPVTAETVAPSGSDDDQTSSAQPDSTTSTTSTTSTVAGEIVPSEEPSVRVPVNPGPSQPTNWVARTFMDDSRVEIVWSPVDGADRYELYRIPTRGIDYAAVTRGEFDGATKVYEGPEYGYVDHEDVPSATFLTYVLVAEIDGSYTEPRWTEALTIPDTTPPTPITGLRSSVTDDGVMLEWDPSTDDVEFAAYSVVLLAADGSRQYLGGGADESQVSFLDTDPVAGANTYEVRAFDFHDNGSEPAQITVSVDLQ